MEVKGLCRNFLPKDKKRAVIFAKRLTKLFVLLIINKALLYQSELPQKVWGSSKSKRRNGL